jgi:hypothetical protein
MRVSISKLTTVRLPMDENLNTVPIGRSLFSVRFVLAVVILVIAGLGLKPTVRALAKYYEKEPIAISRPLKEFVPSRLPSFSSGWDFSHAEASVKDIGTDEYTHIVFKKKELDKEPRRVELFATYYSDPTDKVPHTPDVCFRQAGVIVKKLTTIEIDTPELAPACPKIEASLVIFDEPPNDILDIYFFVVEGEVRPSREQARWVIAKPMNRYTYFSKIEVAARFASNGNPDQALEICKTLVREALPILLAEHFPAKEQLRRR